MPALIRSIDYQVKYISGHSPTRPEPDKNVNYYLERWAFQAAHAEVSRMYLGAVPKENIESKHVLRIMPDDQRGDRWRLMAIKGSEERVLDEGRVMGKNHPDPNSSYDVFELEGTKILNWTVKGMLVPDPSAVSTQPQLAKPAEKDWRLGLGYSRETHKLFGIEENDLPVNSPEVDGSEDTEAEEQKDERPNRGAWVNSRKRSEPKPPKSNGNGKPSGASVELKPIVPSRPSATQPQVNIQTDSSPENVSVSASHTVMMPGSPQIVGNIVRIPVSKIRRCPTQPRKIFRKKKLLETAESLKTKGQLKPIVVVALSPEESGDSETTHEIVDGERRWRSAQLGGISELDCIVKSRAEVQDWIKQHQASIELNNGSEELTPDETVQALLVQHKAGHTYEELGLMFNGKSAGWARGMLLVENLITPIRNRLDPELPRDEQITLGLAKLLAKAPQNRQEGIFNQVWLEKGSKLRNLKAKQLIAEFCDKRKHNNWPHQQRELVRKVPNVLGDVLSLGAVTDSGIESFVRGTAPKDVEAMRRQIAGSIEGLKALEERIADALDHVYKRT